MSLAALRYFGTGYNLDDLTESEQFIELLYHHDHNSYAFLNKKINNEMYQRSFRDKCAFNVCDHNDSWVSLNLFTAGTRRISDNCRELTGFYFDLDKHEGTLNQIQDAAKRSLNLLYAMVDKKILPMPTIITNSGRGLGIYYIFKRSLAVTQNTVKQQQLYSYLYSKVGDILNENFSKEDLLHVDPVVINDWTRIVRIPGSYNTKAGNYCSIANIGEDFFGNVLFYDLSDFKCYIENFDKTHQIIKNKKAAAMNVVSFVGYKSTFLYNRVNQMIKLQYKFNAACTNKRREYMCFVFYNTAKQIYPDAINRLYDFNNNFDQPLSEKELKHVIKSVNDNKTNTYEGYYKISDAWIIDRLSLSEEEVFYTLIGQSQRKIEREAAKEKTRIKRTNRNKEVYELLLDANNTYEFISEQVGVSISTVKRIAKEFKVIRYNKVNFDDHTNNCNQCQNEIKVDRIDSSVNFYNEYSDNEKVHFLSLCLLLCLCFVLGVSPPD
jgi:hypothetical protein